MKKKIIIEGMSCGHCVAHVEKVLKAIQEITEVQVNLPENNAIIELNGETSDERIREAIEDAGYDVAAIEVL